MLDWHDEIIHELARKKSRGSERMEAPQGASIALTLEPSGEIRIKRHMATSELKPRSGGKLAAKRQDAAHLSVAKNSENSERLPSGFGSLPGYKLFGSSAKRKVKNACGALKSKFGKRIVFATLTLAGSTDEARKALATWSGYVVGLLQKWISYHAPGSLWVYKWEWQKSGALHLHAAIGSNNVLHLRALEKGFKAYVHKLHQQISRKSGVDCFQRLAGGSWRDFPDVLRSNCEPVYKCVKRYMAKYITKAAAGEQGYCPARWWGQSRALARVVGDLRLCTVLNTRNWGLVAQLWQAIAELVQPLTGPKYEYSCPFRPTEKVLLYYAPDEDVAAVYSLLRRKLVTAS